MVTKKKAAKSKRSTTPKGAADDLIPVSFKVRRGDILDIAIGLGYTGVDETEAGAFIKQWIKNTVSSKGNDKRRNEKIRQISEQVMQYQDNLMKNNPAFSEVVVE